MLAKSVHDVLNGATHAALDAQRPNLESGTFACETDDFEVVDELTPLCDATIVMDRASPFGLFLAAMKDVARARYGSNCAKRDDSWLAAPHDAVGQAWYRVLRGETSDLRVASGMLLDEWAASAMARAYADPSSLLELRRELRARGVCAFGVLEA